MSKDNGDLYFPHDFNSSNDEKMIAFLSLQGAEGYGIFWLIVEQMHKNEGIYKKKEYNYLATAERSKATAERIKAILSDLVNCELFYTDDDGYYSERVIKNLEKSKKISQQNAENARKRAIKTSDRSTTVSDRSTTANIQDKTKEDKIKEEKKKEKKEIPPVPVVSLSREWMSENLLKTFEDFKKMRKQIKKPLTDAGSELILNKLEKLSDKKIDIAISIFEQSIENSWQGIFNLKPINKEEQKSEYTFNCFNDVFTALYAEFNGKANVYECEQFLRNEDQNGRCDYPLNEVFSWGCKLCKTKYLINEKPKLNDKRWGLTL